MLAPRLKRHTAARHLTSKYRARKLHKSSKDPNEKLDVVTISIHTEKGTRLESDHVREDGTSTKKTTRSGGAK
ncbi:hypothetical protein BST61_g8470 [Cercospora zeina]